MDDAQWLNDEESRAWRGLIAMGNGLRSSIGRALQRDTGLSESDYEVLVHLSEAPERRLRPFELAELTTWEKSRLSHHLRRMTERGLVTREGCPSDNRGAVMALTEHGWAAISCAAPGHVAQVRRYLFDALNVEQVTLLGDIADAVLEQIARCDAAQGANEMGSAASE